MTALDRTAIALVILIVVLLAAAIWFFGVPGVALGTGIFLGILAAILGLLVIAALFGAWWGLGKGINRLRWAFGFGHRVVAGIDRFANRAGNAAVAPLLAVYSKAAWLRGFTRALWREARGAVAAVTSQTAKEESV